jgi:pyruvate formate lyase activating enzyme
LSISKSLIILSVIHKRKALIIKANSPIAVRLFKKRVLNNFKRAGRKIGQRENPPLLIASTFLVPGFVDEVEVKNIAGFIASVDSSIPYSLLEFDPNFLMADLQPTSKAQAERCFEAAKQAGLTRVKIGNTHLLT